MDWATFDNDSKWLILRKTHEKKCVRSPGGPAEEGDEKREKFV